MGCEGGSIPKRSELVKTKKASSSAKGEFEDLNDWFFCALSKKPLIVPIVGDGLGHLYNKDAVLRYLLNKSSFAGNSPLRKSITSLKDVVTLKVLINPSLSKRGEDFHESSIQGNITDLNPVARFICPITGREMNGKVGFSFIFSCGCLFSDQALKMLPGQQCPVCETIYDRNDLIPVNSSKQEDIERLIARHSDVLIKRRTGRGSQTAAVRPGGSTDPANQLAVDNPDVKNAKKRSSDEKTNSHAKKRSRTKKRDHISQKVNVHVPNVEGSGVISLINKSEAVKSLYRQKNINSNTGTYLTMGTFNRFAATF